MYSLIQQASLNSGALKIRKYFNCNINNFVLLDWYKTLTNANCIVRRVFWALNSALFHLFTNKIYLPVCEIKLLKPWEHVCCGNYWLLGLRNQVNVTCWRESAHKKGVDAVACMKWNEMKLYLPSDLIKRCLGL